MALPAAPAPLRPLLRNRTFQQRTPLSGAPVPSIVFVLSSVSCRMLPHRASCLPHCGCRRIASIVFARGGKREYSKNKLTLDRAKPTRLSSLFLPKLGRVCGSGAPGRAGEGKRVPRASSAMSTSAPARVFSYVGGASAAQTLVKDSPFFGRVRCTLGCNQRTHSDANAAGLQAKKTPSVPRYRVLRGRKRRLPSSNMRPVAPCSAACIP